MKYLLENEQRSLLKTLRDSKNGVRDRTIIELVLHTGLRIQECRMLNVSDVFDGLSMRDHLHVRKETAKRCKAREIYLNSHVRKVLKCYIRHMRETCKSLEPTPLFISKKGNRCGQRTLQDMVAKWYIRAGLIDAHGKARYSFHALRHSFSINLRRRGVSLEQIQRLLGHASLQATGIYLGPSREDLIEAIELLAA